MSLEGRVVSANSGLTSSSSSTTVIILCGGKGSRLQGVDKPLLEIDHIPIVERICIALSGIGPILISANRNATRYQHYGTVIADQEADLGPLAGLAACLECCATDSALVVPGDCPDYSRGLAEKLLRALDQGNPSLDAVCATDGSNQQHLHLALKRSGLEGLQQYLKLGGRSVHGWLKQLSLAVLDCREFSAGFADIDNHQDLARRQSALSDSQSLNR
jgi:molybdopterin-guanine dinucleotide biosynthesis protein A